VGKLCGGQIYLQGKGIFLLSIGLHYNTPLTKNSGYSVGQILRAGTEDE
jgi:hypothetical protein